MKRFLLPFLAVFLLSACKQEQVTFRLTFNPAAELSQEELTDAAVRIIERRLSRFGEEIRDIKVDGGEGEAEITLTLSGSGAVNTLAGEMLAPFNLEFLISSTPETADITIPGQGSFQRTGITKEHLQRVKAKSEFDRSSAMITLTFTPEGRRLMGEIFKEHKGEYLGLFLRERLAWKLLIDTDQLKDDIVITDVPQAEIAEIFADDVNVGLHVTFERL